MAYIGNDTLDAGADYSMVVSVFTDETNTTLLNLTGYTARMMLKTGYNAATPAISLTSPSGGLVIDGPNGTMTVTMTSAQTTLLTDPSYVYDLEIVSPGGQVTRVLQGTFMVSPEVTK